MLIYARPAGLPQPARERYSLEQAIDHTLIRLAETVWRQRETNSACKSISARIAGGALAALPFTASVRYARGGDFLEQLANAGASVATVRRMGVCQIPRLARASVASRECSLPVVRPLALADAPAATCPQARSVFSTPGRSPC